VQWSPLDSAAAIHAEQTWRNIYAKAFVGRTRARVGAKAEHAYRTQHCDHYLVVPFTSGVNGLPIHITGSQLAAYECRGSLTDLSGFNNVELFVAPASFDWTMVYTHEDHALGGPYFHRREWLIDDADEQLDAPRP
jgi:hypothetical protein